MTAPLACHADPGRACALPREQWTRGADVCTTCAVALLTPDDQIPGEFLERLRRRPEWRQTHRQLFDEIRGEGGLSDELSGTSSITPDHRAV
jgi:hypothetical protein